MARKKTAKKVKEEKKVVKEKPEEKPEGDELKEGEYELELVVSVSPTDGKAEVKTVRTVKVVSGINVVEVAVAGKTVAEIREALAQPLNISAEAKAMVDGDDVDEGDEKDFVLEEGQQLEFVKSAGVKG